MAISWIYKLNKEELITELRTRDINTEGTVAELRQRLAKFVKANPRIYMDKPDDPADYDEEADKTKDQLWEDPTIDETQPATSTPHNSNSPGPTPNSAPPTQGMVDNHQPDQGQIMDRIRKWNCRFDGKDVHSFLERTHEMAAAYGFSTNQLLQGLPEMLKGDALLWYRNSTPHCQTWQDFETQLRGFYLPTNERRSLARQIADRRQGPDENIRTYSTALLTMMRRRGGYTNEEQLDNLYYGMRAELRIHIRRNQITDANDLIQQAEEIHENLQQQRRDNKNQNTSRQHTVPVVGTNSAYDRRTCCWRCKQRGHSRNQCQNQRRLFCSVCGKDGVFTRDCHPNTMSGNGKGTEPRSDRTRSNTMETTADSLQSA